MVAARARARVDPDDPTGLPTSPILEWYRFDAGGTILRRLSVGAMLMVLGMFAVTRLVIAGDRGSLAWGLFGIACVAGSGLYSVLGLQRVLQQERYVAFRVDGVLLVHDEGRRHLRWEDIEDVVHDAALDAVVFVGRDGEDWVLCQRFAGIDNLGLARAASRIRRRATFGLYRT